mgnify:CR=1 FL=1
MSEERPCIDVRVSIWFDARSYTEAKRKFDTSIRICLGDDIDDIAEQIATELAESWARRTRVREREKIEFYRDGIYDYIRHYLYTAIQELYERLREDIERCRRYPSDVVYEEGSDGYYEEEENRGMFISAETTFVCRDIDKQIEIVESLIETPIRRREIIEEMFEKLPICKQHVVMSLIVTTAPHEDILDWLEMICGARWWYTVYYTRNK